MLERRVRRFPNMPDGTKISGTSVLEQIMRRVQPDGSIMMNWGGTEYAEPINLSRMAPQALHELQIELAGKLYRHVERVCHGGHGAGDRLQNIENEEMEPLIALEFSRFRHEPGFLAGVSRIADEAMEARLAQPPRWDIYPSVR